MKRQIILACLGLLFVLTGTGARDLQAQATRTEGTFFLRPQGGVASYVGDNNKTFLSFDESFPYSAGLELGYQFSHPFSLGAGYLVGNYPGITASGDADVRHTGQVLLRYTFGGETGVAPYLQTGFHATFGKVTPAGTNRAESKTAFGPLAGLGLDLPVGRGVSLYLEGTTRFGFPDDAVDGRDNGGSGGFDLLSTLGAGLTFSLGSGAVAPQVLALTGPERLRAGQDGTYTATVNEERATRPVTYRWDFGDGATAEGLTATHRWAAPGTYTVRFTATNRKGTDTRTLSVRVDEALVPATIVTMTADPMNPEATKPVRFNATIRGTTPITYAWDFGDGGTSANANPTHTYAREGTYTVTLDVRNEAGQDRRTMTVTVKPFVAQVCLEVTEMNSVFFERNASTLSQTARRSLEENADILLECPNLNARVEGFAAAGERNPQRLSEDRARAVEAYYTERGVAASRLSTVGRGTPRGTTSKKDGARQNQRADTIPLR